MRTNSSAPIFLLRPVKVLSPLNFEKEMKVKVLPTLEKCRREEWTQIKGKFCKVKGIKEGRPGFGFVHWVFYDAASFDASLKKVICERPVGTVVISIGFTQSEMRFSELAWYFLEYGLSVLIIEHRGHGLSSREISDPEIVKVSCWKDYRKDFALVIKDAEKKGYLSRPLFLFAHSMGGAIGASVEEAFPLLFDRAVLSAPMLLPKMKLPAFIMQMSAELMCLIGKGNMRVPGSAGFAPPNPKEPASYKVRDEWYFSKCLPCAIFHLADPCCKWSREALRMDRKILKKREIGKILTPTLIFQALKDSLVDPRAQDSFVRKAKSARVPAWICKVNGAKHTIFCSPSSIFSRYLAMVIGFYFSACPEQPRLVE